MNETDRTTIELSAAQRLARGLGGVAAMAAGVAAWKYIPFDAHDSVAFTPAFALMLEGAGLMGVWQGVRGRATVNLE